MKAKILRRMMMVMVLLGALTMGAWAADAHTNHCICGGENKIGTHTEHTRVKWTAWEQTDSLPTEAGDYYLTTGVTLTEPWHVKSNIRLCLDGYSISAGADMDRLIYVEPEGSLGVTNCNRNMDHPNILASDCTAGGIYAGGNLELYYVYLSGFQSDENGGAIFIDSAAQIQKVKISDCAATGFGGGIYLSESGTMEIALLDITSCTANKGGGIYAANSFSMTGETKKILSNHSEDGITDNVFLSGNSHILDISTLSHSSIDIGISTDDYSVPKIIFSNSDYADKKTTYIINDTPNTYLVPRTNADGAVEYWLAEAQPHQNHCDCVGNSEIGDHTAHNSVEWKPWESRTELPTEPGYYYLTNDILQLTNYGFLSPTSLEENIHLCLNGHKILSGAVLEGAVFTVTDCCETMGTLYNLEIEYGSTFDLFNGTVYMSSKRGTSLMAYVPKGAKLDMYGGQILVKDTVYFGGTCNLYGGTLKNDLFTRLMVIQDTAEVTIDGGTIDGCYISSEGSLTMESGTIMNINKESWNCIEGNFVLNGGTIRNCYGEYIISSSNFTMNGGTIEDCSYLASIISSEGVVTMNGGKILNNAESRFYMAHVVDSYAGWFVMNGGTIEDSVEGVTISGNAALNGGTITGRGNNIIKLTSDHTLRVGGNTQINVIKDGKPSEESGIYLEDTVQIEVTAKLEDGARICFTAGVDKPVIVGTADYDLTEEDLQKFVSPYRDIVGKRNDEGKLEGWLEIKRRTITFDTDGGSEIQPITLKCGASLPAVANPTKQGYTFKCWEPALPATMPTENLTVKAIWTKNADPTPTPTPDPDPQPPKVSFTDVPAGKYYTDAVSWAVANEITNGTTATTFSPDNACNRGQIVVFLWRLAGKPIAQNRNNPFTDVKEGSFCYEAVLWAAEQGITTGKTATTFCPAETCNRGQIVTFLWRYAGKPAPQNQNRQFVDVAAGSFCDQAVMWAVENQITLGVDATHFNPTGKCTRGHAVTFLYRGRDLLKK